MKVNIITYGCTANQGDSYLMESVLQKSGHQITDFDNADYVIVNTCAVKDATENKIIHKLSSLSKTGKKIIIGGCLTRVSLERIKKSVPGFSAILDTKSIGKLPAIIDNLESLEISESGKPAAGMVFFSEEAPIKPNLIKKPENLTSIVQISEGCDLSCSYCATTIARGDLQCFSSEDIVRACSFSVRNGAKEILLTSQDNGAYKHNGNRLPDLLEKICGINYGFFLRNGMTNPMYLNSILSPLVQAYKNPKVYKFLHLPVQSGSDKILRKMKRGYRVEAYRKFTNEFRKEIPSLTLSTDIIVGFPGETEQDFEKTKTLLEETRFDVVNLSKFSARPGTEAAGMEQVDRKTVNTRSAELSSLLRKISLEKNKEWVGWVGKVFVNEVPELLQIGQEKEFTGRNIFYKPVRVISENDIFGKLVEVKITGSAQANLIGEMV